MNLPLLSTYTLAVLLLIITPGPVVALVTHIAARSGSRQAFATVIGTNAASLVLIALAIAMLCGLMSVSPFSLALSGVLGSLYLGYLALRGIFTPFTAQTTPTHGGQKSGMWGGFLTGLSNPKDVLFFVAFFPQFITITPHFSTSVLVLSLVWVVLDFAILSLYILAIKRWVTARHQRIITLLSCWILLGIACAGALYNSWMITAALSP